MEYKELVYSFASSLGLEGVQTEGGACAFEIDGMKVNIFHDETAGTVMIYGEIGLPSSDDDRTFGTAMLKANHLFGGTGTTSSAARAAPRSARTPRRANTRSSRRFRSRR